MPFGWADRLFHKTLICDRETDSERRVEDSIHYGCGRRRLSGVSSIVSRGRPLSRDELSGVGARITARRRRQMLDWFRAAAKPPPLPPSPLIAANATIWPPHTMHSFRRGASTLRDLCRPSNRSTRYQPTPRRPGKTVAVLAVKTGDTMLPKPLLVYSSLTRPSSPVPHQPEKN